MTRFTRRLDTQQGLLSFYFNEIFTAAAVRYHVSVVGRDNKVYMTNMEKKGEQWVMVSPETCPHWIAVLEKTFARLIQESLENGSLS